MEDPRYKGQINGVVIEMEDPRCKSLFNSVVIEMEDPRCKSLFDGVVIEMEDPRYKRSEEHTSELQSLRHLVCRLLLEKKKQTSHTQAALYTPRGGTKRTPGPHTP